MNMYFVGETTGVEHVRLQRPPLAFRDRITGMQTAIREAHHGGASISCGHFSMVIDKPEKGREQKDITAQRFTNYLAEGQVPIASPRHPMFGHDAIHAVAYTELFRMKPFADLVIGAARFARDSGDPDLIIAVPDALDTLSDYYLQLANGSDIQYDDIVQIRTNLERLWLIHPERDESTLEWLECGLGLSQAEAHLWFNESSPEKVALVPAAGIDPALRAHPETACGALALR